MKKKKFGAILACRNGGTRLFGKPLQLLDIENRITILDYLIKSITQSRYITSMCLAIADSKDNYIFADIAEKNGWQYVFGDTKDVLGRIVKAIDKFDKETVFYGSSESPFLYYNSIDNLYKQHLLGDYDFSMFSDLPEGAGFALVRAEALRISHKEGTSRHRSELVTSYIFDNKDKFKLNIQKPEKILRRPEVRITVDYPEDLVFCRKVYRDLNGKEQLIETADIISYWDKNDKLRKQVEEIGVDWGHGRLWE